MVPKWMLSTVGVKAGGSVEVTANDGKLFVAPSRRDPEQQGKAARQVGADEATDAFDRVLGEMARTKPDGDKDGEGSG